MELEGNKIGLIGGSRGGLKYTPAQRELAEKFRTKRKVCRKCYARLPLNAYKCRKRKCGHCSNIRMKKKFISSGNTS